MFPFHSRCLSVCKAVEVNKHVYFIKFPEYFFFLFLTQKVCRCSQTIKLPIFFWVIFLITLKLSLNFRKVPLAVRSSFFCTGLLQTLNSHPLPNPSLLVPLQPLINNWRETSSSKPTLSQVFPTSFIIRLKISPSSPRTYCLMPSP